MSPPATWTQLDLARAVAREFAAALKRADPERYAVLVRAAKELRQGWIEPRPDAVPPGERLTTAQASELLHVPESTIRGWAADDSVPVWRQYGGYDPQELFAYQASKRTPDQARKDLAADLAARYQAGATLGDLAEHTGRSAHYVTTLLGEAGVVLRRRGHR